MTVDVGGDKAYFKRVEGSITGKQLHMHSIPIYLCAPSHPPTAHTPPTCSAKTALLKKDNEIMYSSYGSPYEGLKKRSMSHVCVCVCVCGTAQRSIPRPLPLVPLPTHAHSQQRPIPSSLHNHTHTPANSPPRARQGLSPVRKQGGAGAVDRAGGAGGGQTPAGHS